MTPTHPDRTISPRVALENIIAEYGLKPVILALVSRVFHSRAAHKPKRFWASDLSDHLRRDVGLPPDAPPRTYLNLR